MKLIRILIIWSFISFGSGFSSSSLAKEWYFQPNASVRTLYNTNIRLLGNGTTAGLKDAFGFISSADANFGVRSDNYDVGVNAAGVIRRYISDLNLDSDNVYVNATSNFNVTERNKFSLNGLYADETVLSSILDSTDSAQENTQRSTLSINPEWTYTLSELTSIQVDYKHSDVSYGDAAQQDNTQNQNGNSQNQGSRFTDYTRDTGSVELSHRWTEAMNTHFGFDALLYEASPSQTNSINNSSTTNYNFNFGIDYNFSDTWAGAFGSGVRVTDNEPNSANFSPTRSVGPLFSMKLQKTFDTSTLAAGYYRETVTRGSGGLSLADVGYVSYNQQLSDRLEVRVRASYNDFRVISLTSRPNDYTFYSAAASATWSISRQLDLTGSYQYRCRESQQNSDNNAHSNDVYLTLNYRWDAFSTRKF